MSKDKIKNYLKHRGITPEGLLHGIAFYSLKLALVQQGLDRLIDTLRQIVPDISQQEAGTKETFNPYWEYKRRGLQAFQSALMLRALKGYAKRNLSVADIGDSAGTHMLYLKNLANKLCYQIDSVSVNLDPRAIDKIRSRGLKAILCRAENLELPQNVDLAVSFQMIEHLHNPIAFLRRLATRTNCDRLVITSPFLPRSRVGLYHARKNNGKRFFAEDEHIFELSPGDWSLLMLFSGWKIVYQDIYYQYPRGYPLLSQLLGLFWRRTDFAGFWGAILERDDSLSSLYQDWWGEDERKS